MIYYGNKKIANNNVRIHGDTITIENNAKTKVVNLISDLPSTGDDVIYAVKEDQNLYYWNLEHSTGIATRTLVVTDTVGTTQVMRPDGFEYVKGVTRNIGKGKFNVSLNPVFQHEYNATTGIISITLTSSTSGASVSTTVTYQETVSEAGWDIFGSVTFELEDGSVTEAKLSSDVQNRLSIVKSLTSNDDAIFATGGSMKPNNRVVYWGNNYKKLGVGTIVFCNEPGYKIIINYYSNGTLITSTPWTNAPCKIVCDNNYECKIQISKSDESSFTNLTDTDNFVKINYNYKSLIDSLEVNNLSDDNVVTLRNGSVLNTGNSYAVAFTDFQIDVDAKYYSIQITRPNLDGYKYYYQIREFYENGSLAYYDESFTDTNGIRQCDNLGKITIAIAEKNDAGTYNPLRIGDFADYTVSVKFYYDYDIETELYDYKPYLDAFANTVTSLTSNDGAIFATGGSMKPNNRVVYWGNNYKKLGVGTIVFCNEPGYKIIINYYSNGTLITSTSWTNAPCKIVCDNNYECKIQISKSDESSFTNLTDTDNFVKINYNYKSLIDSLEVGETENNIVTRNKDIEHIVNACANYGQHADGIQNVYRRFTMLITSDIHTSQKQLHSAVEYINAMSCFDLGVSLGDLQSSYFNDNDGTWYTNIIKNSRVNWLTVLGNHDHGNSKSTTQAGTANQVVAKFITPNNAYSGVDTNTAYYYKDIDNHKIRIIVLDSHDTPDDLANASEFLVHKGVQVISQNQANWLVSTLNSTPTNYGVIILSHAIPFSIIKNTSVNFHHPVTPASEERQDGIVCDIVNAWITGTSLTKTYTVTSYSNIPDVSVNADFTSRGTGIFVSYICGHTHSDFVGKISRYENQNVIVVNSTANDNWQNGEDDLPRAVGTKAEDSITLVSVHIEERAIYIVRIGSDTSKFLTKREPSTISF